jgi:hypothetical protein
LTTIFAKEGAMLRTHGPAAGRGLGWIAIGLMFVALAAVPAQAQDPAPAPANQRLFNGDAGLWLHFVKPDKTADFEAVIAKLKEALGKSEKPERKQQAASWKVFKQADPVPAGGNVLYVMFLDPSVKDVDYTVSTILAESLPPAEVNELFKQYAEAYGSPAMNVVNLALIQHLGQ